MTLEELKIEADKLGFTLTKKTHYVKFKPCICGSNRRETWNCMDGTFYKCASCGLESRPGRTHQESKKNWNNLVKDYIISPKKMIREDSEL